MTQADKPRVGVSQCLLGDAVRYDGASKANLIVLEKFCRLFELFAVCPEVEAGLGVPRPAVQLTGSIDEPKLTGRDDPELDITRIMQQYCTTRPAQLDQLSGFIFKSRSPSCGLNSTPVFIDGNCITENSRGIFARAFCEHYPMLPVIEDIALTDNYKIEDFIKAVRQYKPAQTTLA